MRGGKRAGAGRRPGAISKAKRELAEMAKDHAPAALKTLAEISVGGESESARVSAATAILDRAYGKPPQAMTIGGDPDNPLLTQEVTDQKRLAAVALMAARTVKAESAKRD